MLRITVELLPGGSEARKQVLAVGEITNDGTGDSSTGNYDVWLSKRHPHLRQTWRTGRVDGFPRKRLGVWDLLFRALTGIVKDRNTKPSETRVHPSREPTEDFFEND